MTKFYLAIFIIAFSITLFAEQYTLNSYQNEVSVIVSNSEQTVLEMTLGHFNREAIQIDGKTFWSLNLKKEGITLEAGMPELPYISRSIIIPARAKMTVNTLESEFVDVVMPVAPSKGNLTRDINPDDIPWEFDSFYSGSGHYPEALTRLSEPFILRDYRGITAYFQPFVYYPETKTLRIYTKLKIAITNSAIDDVNVLKSTNRTTNASFKNIYESMFLNYAQAKYPVLDEYGRILIINHSLFSNSIQPYVDWKRQKGFIVDVVDISVAGPSASQLKTYIQNQYNLNTDLAFVQIMGDHAQVPSLTSGSGASDPSFCLTAGSDSYPDLFIGRFSAQTVAELETQITRSIHYERDMQSDNLWLAAGMGIASNQGGGSQGDLGESDQTHMEYIRTDLLSYGYTAVDQVYQAQNATQAMISNGVNQGRGIINYCGHGSDNSWVTTGFSNTQVNQLTNDFKLPFIVSVACVNGNFTNQTCFAEAWLRAKDSATGAPRGALVFWGSSINQSWNPPMRAQDEVVDLILANQKNTIGGLFFNGASKMIEVYGTGGSDMYKTWHIFGDASLQVRTTAPQPLTAQYINVLNLGVGTFSVHTNPGALVSLYAAGINYGTAYADNSGDAVINLNPLPADPMDLTLTITAFNRVTHVATIQVLPSNGPYLLYNNHIVSDNNNNRADFGEVVQLNIILENIGSASAENITATISTQDPYITIIDSIGSFSIIGVNNSSASVEGFSIQIANNVPDQYNSPIHVAIAENDTVKWEYNFELLLNAPAFSSGTIIINDSAGNNNGRIDRGELVTLSFPVYNCGHSNSSDLLVSLLVNNNLNHVITPVQSNFTSIPVDGSVNAVFDIAFSSQIPAGTQAHLTLLASSGSYSMSQHYSSFISINVEDFESGDLSSYPWTFNGEAWFADSLNAHNGRYSAQSPDIGDNGNTQMILSIDTPVAGFVRFYKKLSTENGLDFLRFYINGVLKNQWSGNIDWTQESYGVEQGVNTYKWEYAKDYMLSSGYDCVWIDEIEFPTNDSISLAPILSIDTNAFIFGSHTAGSFTAIPFSITNNGIVAMIGSIAANDLFQIRPASEGDYAAYLDFVILGGETKDFELMAFVERLGTYNSVLVINTDDPENPMTEIPINAVVIPLSSNDDNVVSITKLIGNYPNPFNPETSISFSLKADEKVNLEIYNLLGQKVRTLANGSYKKGNHSLKWNGKDDKGRDIGSGIYFYRMKTDSYTSTQKMILMK